MSRADVQVFLSLSTMFNSTQSCSPPQYGSLQGQEALFNSPTHDMHISILITIGYSQLLEARILLKSHVQMQHLIITAENYSEII